MSDREEFLAGKRPSEIHIFLHDDSVSNAEALEAHGERVENGIVLLMDGDQGREVFQQATGIDPMALAQDAMKRDGTVNGDCTEASCPKGEAHTPKFIFSFAEEQNEEVGGLYADGPVIHAYVACDCGTRYSDKWVLGE